MDNLVCCAAVYKRDPPHSDRWRRMGYVVMHATYHRNPFRNDPQGHPVVDSEPYAVTPELPPGITLKKLLTRRTSQE